MKEKSRAVTRMSLVALAASSALVLGACGGGGNAPAAHQAAPAQSGAGSTGVGAGGTSCIAGSQVLSNTHSYDGKQITITGTVAQVVGPHAFTVAAGGDNRSNAQPLLAVDKDNMQLTQGSPVQITGTLQPAFDANEAATFTGGNLGQDQRTLTSFNGKPYVQAAFAGPISTNLTQGSQGGIVSGGNSGTGSCAAASDVLSKMQSYTGQQVTITGTVGQVVGPHAVTVAPTGNNTGNNAQPLLAVAKEVAVTNETGMLTPGAPVQVTGTLQPTFDLNQAVAFAGSNLDPASFTPYNGKPYVQATFAGPVSANLASGQQR